ncbi:MAG: ACP phosphodiesterase, partial [Bacteroidota bacterium]
DYGKVSGIAFTFDRMQRRVSQPQYLEGVVESLSEQTPHLTADFAQFFPDVQAEVQRFCNC